jgi:hypothetical protein
MKKRNGRYGQGGILKQYQENDTFMLAQSFNNGDYLYSEEGPTYKL